MKHSRRLLECSSAFREELRRHGVEIIVVNCEDSLYPAAIDLATTAYALPAEQLRASEDAYSHIYVAMVAGRLVGTITVTWAKSGPMEAETLMPADLIAAYRDRVCTAYRLATDSQAMPEKVLSRLLMRASFADGIAHGMRLAIATSKPRMLRYYDRVGYQQVVTPLFEHPRLSSPHYFVLCVVHPDHHSWFQDLCASVSNPVSFSEVGRWLLAAPNERNGENGIGATAEGSNVSQPIMRQSIRKRVDWASYAMVYDVMCDHNPAYGDMVAQIRQIVADWKLEPGDRVADFGAGTGNVSQVVAELHPTASVLHVDADVQMVEQARRKMIDAGHSNVRFLRQDAAKVEIERSSLAAGLCIHALYTFPDPQAFLRRVYEQLQPRAHWVVCDLGRLMRVEDWAAYLFRHAHAELGLLGAAGLFIRGRRVAAQNRRIARMQSDGQYWLHSADELRAALHSAGFEVVDIRSCYRGYSDLAVCRKSTIETETRINRCHVELPTNSN